MDIMRIHDMKETLTEWAKAELERGKECVCTDEMGKVIDMIKDLADAEKNCYEAKFYCKVVKAMEETGDIPAEMPNFRMGYDNWRYASGRFAPTGHGHRSGYMPPYLDPMMYGKDGEDWRMGYDDDMLADKNGRIRHSGAYDKYLMSKRHYTETHSPSDKAKMDESAKEQIEETVETMKDIWTDADPMLRKKMREELNKLVSEMPA